MGLLGQLQRACYGGYVSQDRAVEAGKKSTGILCGIRGPVILSEYC